METTQIFLPQYTVPTEFLHYVGIGYGFCAFAGIMSATVIGPKVFGKHYELQDPNQVPTWHATFVALFPCFIVPILAWPDIRALFVDRSLSSLNFADLALNQASVSIWKATGFSIGYMLFDTTLMLLWPKKCLKTMKALYWQYMAHHILSAILWPYSLWSGKSVGFVTYFLCTEITSLFVNSRWFFNACKADSGIIFYLLALTMILSYTAIRAIPAPFIFWFLLQGDYSGFDWPQFLTTVMTVPIPAMLNMFWYYLIMRGAYRKLFGKKKGGKDSPQGKSDKKKK